ncbi:MAG: hypothetical protein HAW67_01045, partial [Endozoicomonadaceae bacterium]|nr:hypothetical protein [Endozoicomonadaceae bacterium]
MKANPFLNTTIRRCIILQILYIFSFSAAVNAEFSTAPQTSIKGISASYQIIDPSPLGPGTPPTFAKVFSPDFIGPGSVSTLQFSITSIDDAADNITFTDVLPAGMVIATPANAISTCDGEITASSGGNSISFTGGRVAALATCTISVNVASSTLGTATNNTGDLTSSLGNSGIATDDLIVSAA